MRGYLRTTPVNLFNPAEAENGKLIDYADGIVDTYVPAISSGRHAVVPGNTYFWSVPSTEKGLKNEIFCFAANGWTYLGLDKLKNPYPLAVGVTVSAPTTINGRLGFTIAIAADSDVRFISCQMIDGYDAAHGTGDFNRIVGTCQLEVGSTPTAFQSYRGAISGSVTPPVRVIKDGTTWYIRTENDATTDLVHVLTTATSTTANSPISFVSELKIPVATASTAAAIGSASNTGLFGSVTDNVCPIQINGYYVGGHHGYYGFAITKTSHGKTSDDLGSLWTTATGYNWYIVKIVNANSFWVVAETKSTGQPWSFLTTIGGTTFTHVSGATNTDTLTGTTSAAVAILPAIQAQTRTILLDGEVTPVSDGLYYCNFVDFVNSYDIIDVPSIATYLAAEANHGKEIWQDVGIDSVATMQTTYRFNRNGSRTDSQRVTFLKHASLGYIGIVQESSISVPSGGKKWQYIPLVSPYTVSEVAYDFKACRDVTSDASYHQITLARWEDASNPPNRFIQFATDSDEAKVSGVAIGYCTQVGMGDPTVRAVYAVDSAFMLSDSEKQYPKLIGGGLMTAGTVIEAVAFSCPINYATYPDATNVSWYWVGSDVYLMLDYHSAYSGLLPLPDYLADMSVEVIESDGISTSPYTSSTGQLSVSVSGSYGTAVLRLYADGSNKGITYIGGATKFIGQ